MADIQGVEVPLEDEEAKEEETSAQKRNSFVKFLRSILFAGREDEEDEMLRKKKKPLPHWLIYIGYVFSLSVSFLFCLSVCLSVCMGIQITHLFLIEECLKEKSLLISLFVPVCTHRPYFP